MIRVHCPKCGKEYRLKESMAGKTVRCKNGECGEQFRVPGSAPEPSDSEDDFMKALSDAVDGETSAAFEMPPPPPVATPRRRKKGKRRRAARDGEVDGADWQFWLPRIVVCVAILGLDVLILVTMVVAK